MHNIGAFDEVHLTVVEIGHRRSQADILNVSPAPLVRTDVQVRLGEDCHAGLRRGQGSSHGDVVQRDHSRG